MEEEATLPASVFSDHTQRGVAVSRSDTPFATLCSRGEEKGADPDNGQFLARQKW